MNAASGFHIRPGQPQDWKSIFRIQNRSELLYFTGYSIPPTEEAVREKWERRLSEPLTHTLVAEIDSDREVVGYVRLKLGEGKGSHVGEISILAVREDWQRRGVGMLLMTEIIDLADNSFALKRLRLTVHADNQAAVRLYEKLGFEIEGRERKAVFKDGMHTDLLVMGRIT